MIFKAAWILLFVFSPALPLAVYFRGNWYSIMHSYSLGMFFGIIAYCYFLNTLILATRLRFLDRVFGHNEVLILHGHLAVIALISSSFHGYFKWMFTFDYVPHVNAGIAAQMIFATVTVVSLLLMVTTIFHRIPVLHRIRQALLKKRFFDYSVLKLFHNSISIATLLMVYHVFNASATQESFLRIRLMTAWAAIAVSLYVYHKILRPAIKYGEGWFVKGLDEKAPGIFEITLSRPPQKRGSNNRPIHQAGQFGYFRFLSSLCGYEEHPFTILSPPESEDLCIAVKVLGDYTSRLARISTGTRVLFDGPYGVFTPAKPVYQIDKPGDTIDKAGNMIDNAGSVVDNADADKKLLFIAGGIGITPFHSILKSWYSTPSCAGKEATAIGGAKENDKTDEARAACANSQQKKIILIWSCRKWVEMIYRSFYQSLSACNSDFLFVPVITREKTSGDIAQRIDRELLKSVVSAEEYNKMEAYICGPESLRKTVSGFLKESGVKSGAIHYEAFS